MTRQRIVEQVNGILAIRGIPVRHLPDDDALLVEFDDGSSALDIRFSDFGTRTIITISAMVLVRIRVAPEQRLEVLERLNEINRHARFGRLVLDDEQETIRLDYDLLGDELDTSEFVVPLEAMAEMADELDDRLMADFGAGQRVADLKALFQELSDSGLPELS